MTSPRGKWTKTFWDTGCLVHRAREREREIEKARAREWEKEVGAAVENIENGAGITCMCSTSRNGEVARSLIQNVSDFFFSPCIFFILFSEFFFFISYHRGHCKPGMSLRCAWRNGTKRISILLLLLRTFNSFRSYVMPKRTSPILYYNFLEKTNISLFIFGKWGRVW